MQPKEANGVLRDPTMLLKLGPCARKAHQFQ
jgi:hypothetical protein